MIEKFEEGKMYRWSGDKDFTHGDYTPEMMEVVKDGVWRKCISITQGINWVCHLEGLSKSFNWYKEGLQNFEVADSIRENPERFLSSFERLFRKKLIQKYKNAQAGEIVEREVWK